MFCCGCSVRFGVGCIVLAHLAACCFYVASACSNLVFKVALFSSSWSPIAQLFYTGFCLVGIPITVMAFYGAVMRREANLRIYLFYLALSFLIDLGGLVYVCLIEDPCQAVSYLVTSLSEKPGSRAQVVSGEAFMCGAFRIASYAVVTFAVCVEIYCLYIVWSMCEDIHGGKNGPAFGELVMSRGEKIRRRPTDGPYASIVGFAKKTAPGAYPSVYGTIMASGMRGQSAIFGTEHETSYPPPQIGQDVFL